MRTLYVSQPGCYVSLHQEMLVIKKGESVLGEVQLTLLEQVLIFGQSQVTTQAIRTCLWRSIPIAYLSRMGYCYGRILPSYRARLPPTFSLPATALFCRTLAGCQTYRAS